MSRTLKLFQGADLAPEWDYSDWVEWLDCKFGVRANNGEATQGELRIRDVLGETGSELNLPGGLTFRSIAAHNTMTLTEDASGAPKHIWRGWVIPKDYTRGVQKADRAREIRVAVEDYNTELRGIIVGRDAPEERPQETDVERVEWLRSTYLDGDPRASTVIGDAYIAAGNTVTLEAKTYEDATVDDVLRDCATPADKRYWVILNDDGSMDLFYDIITSAAYASTLQIRQTGDPVEVDNVTTFAPKWDIGPASREDGQQLLSGLKLKGPPGVSAYVNHAATVSNYNHFEEVINDQFTETDAEAAAKAQGILNVRRFELRTYSCSILVPANRVHLIKAGMNITIQAKAIPDADDQVVTRRIGQCTYKVYNPDLYRVELQLDRPMRAGPLGTGSPVGPKPPKPSTPGSVTTYESWDWDSGQEHVANIYASDLPGPVQMLGQTTTSGPENGAAGTPFSGGFGTSNFSTGRVAATAATVYRFFGYLQLFGESWPSTDHGRVNGSWGVTWYTAGDAEIRTDVIGSYANQPQDGPFLGPDEIDLVAPANTAYFRMRSAIDPLLPGQPLNTKIDQVVISVVTAAGISGTSPPTLGGPGEGQFGNSDTYLPADSVIEHGDLSGKGGIMHDANQLGITDAGGYFDGTTVEAALQQLAVGIAGGPVTDHGSMGATETFDVADGSDHEGTLNANLTVTLTGATAGSAAFLTLVLTQDGTGGWTITWPGAVVWPGGVAPVFDTTAGTVSIVNLFTYDGGATWYGFLVGDGGGASLPAAVDGHGLFWDGATLKSAQSPEPLLLEDDSLAVLENGRVAMSEPIYD